MNWALSTPLPTAKDGDRDKPTYGQPAEPTNIRPALRVRFDPSHDQPLPYDVEPAIEGNHLAIQALLQRVLHGPPSAEFAASVLRPGYKAAERLIVKRPSDRSLLGHVQVEMQELRFGDVDLPIGRIRGIAVLDECKQRGLDDTLLRAAEAKAKRDGAMLLTARAEDSRLLQRNGWVSLGTDPISMVSPQRLMGQLPPRAVPESPFYANQLPQEEVRLGRLTDLDILQQMYEARTSGAFGASLRSRDYWSWLISKSAHDRMYIYLEDACPLGYVVVRGASVIELIDCTDDHRASARLLEHVGADAIEQGRHSLRIHAPLTARAHVWAEIAGGQLVSSLPEDAWMVKVPSVRTLLRRLASSLHRRIGKRTEFELSMRIANEEFLIRNGVRSMKVTRGKAAQHRVGLTARGAAQLILGHRNVMELAADKKLVVSNKEALRLANLLFPALDLWRSQWDEVQVESH